MLPRYEFRFFLSRVLRANSALPVIVLRGPLISWDTVRRTFSLMSSSVLFCLKLSSSCFRISILCITSRRIRRYAKISNIHVITIIPDIRFRDVRLISLRSHSFS